MKILKNGNVNISNIIDLILKFPVPKVVTSDHSYDQGFSEGYNAALDDLSRNLSRQANHAPKAKPRGAGVKNNG